MAEEGNMKKTILLAVDAARQKPGRHVAAAVAMTRDLSSDTGDQVIVLHVHEFSASKFGRAQVDCLEGEGDALVDEIVGGLRNAGITAKPEIRQADLGYTARVILAAADEHDARIIVLGSSGRTDMPHLPFGSVSHRLLHLARRPVLIVPRDADVDGTAEPAASATATAS
jgi:nucleotide-binding universal stress UspA family protein